MPITRAIIVVCDENQVNSNSFFDACTLALAASEFDRSKVFALVNTTLITINVRDIHVALMQHHNHADRYY